MNEQDIERRGLSADHVVSLQAVSPDGMQRQVDGFRIIPFDLPAGCVAGYTRNATR